MLAPHARSTLEAEGRGHFSPQTRTKHSYVTPPHHHILQGIAAKNDLALMVQD